MVIPTQYLLDHDRDISVCHSDVDNVRLEIGGLLKDDCCCMYLTFVIYMDGPPGPIHEFLLA